MSKVTSITSALLHTHECTSQPHGMFDFAIVRSGRKFFREAESLGLLVSKTCVHLDDDGAETEKQSVGYKLTDAGRAAINASSAQVEAFVDAALRRFVKQPNNGGFY